MTNGLMMIRLSVVVCAVVFVMACSANPYYDASKPHHTPSGFKNLYYDDSKKDFWSFMRWKWQQIFIDRPNAEDYSFPVTQSQHDLVFKNRQRTSLTWIGHASFLLQFRGLNILTDPQFSKRASPLENFGPVRVVDPAMRIDQLPDIDVIVISHDHYDSLDKASIIALAHHNRERPLTIMVPLGLKQWFDKLALSQVKVVELDWSETHEAGGVRFIAEPVQHWSKRSLFDAFERLWTSWVIQVDGVNIYFAGDTGYAPHFKELGIKYGYFNLAMLPIGAYAPRWFMKPYHLNPQEALMVHRDIASRYSVAMHWGTFILADEPLDEPPRILKQLISELPENTAPFKVYTHGMTEFFDF